MSDQGDLAASLREYKEQYAQIAELAAADPGNEEYKALLGQLKEAIDLTEDVLKSQAAPAVANITKQLMAGRFPEGKAVQALYEPEGKWYDAKVVEANEEANWWRVQYLGYDEEAVVTGVQIRERMDMTLFAPGSKCMAQWDGDKGWYKGTVHAAINGVYTVKFDKHETVQNCSAVQLASLDTYKVDKVRARMTDLKHQDIPEHLKLKPNDSEAEKERKLKKIKAIKANNRFAKKEEERNVKKASWQSFQNKAIKKGIVKKKDSMFKTPEGNSGRVGVVGSGAAMTDFSERMKVQHQVAKSAVKSISRPDEM